MPKSLKELEAQRIHLFQRLRTLGDFRPVTNSINYRKCGKQNCARARPLHYGHGPQFLWNTPRGGKSRAQNLRLGAELEKARTELENYDRFIRLCKELVSVSEQILYP